MPFARRVSVSALRIPGSVLCAAALFAWAAISDAADYPTRPITLISPTVAGGAMDTVARVVAENLSVRLGQPVVVEAKPGASGMIGLGIAARAPADGHTLVIAVDTFFSVAPKLIKGNTFWPAKELAPVAQIGTQPMVLVANPSMGVKTLPEYLSAIRANPGRSSFGTASNGSPHHLCMALLDKSANIRHTQVPYKGGAQAFADLLGGHVQSMFIVMTTAEGQIRDGKVVALGMTGNQRDPAFPHIPAIAEVVPGFSCENWFGIFAPRSTPQPIVDRLNQEISRIIAEPAVAQKIKTAAGMDVRPTTPQELARKIAAESPRMDALIEYTGISAQ